MKKFLVGLSLLFSFGKGPVKPDTLLVQGQVDSDLADKVVSFLDSHSGPVTLVINGPGGDVFSAQIIENAIERTWRSYVRSPWICFKCRSFNLGILSNKTYDFRIRAIIAFS